MNKMAKNDLRIEKIMSERKNLLSLVKENILKDNNLLHEDINQVISLLKYDEENIKKHNALIKAQNLIEDLTKQIVEAKTKEEIMAIRNKLNYYINKIKKEAVSRGINEEDYNKFYANASILRKDIAKYIRFLKKEERIEKLKEENSNYDNLTDDEKKQFSKKLSNERSYNTRIMKMPIESTYTKKELKDESDKIQIFHSMSSDIKLRKKNLETYKDDTDYLTQKVLEFSRRYYVVEPHEYTNSTLKNIGTYIRNIHIYFANKRSIHNMLVDYVHYYGGDDLMAYIEYNKVNNSLREGLKSIFKKSSLYNKENITRSNHERCIEWMLNFINERDIKLNYELAKEI